MNQQVSAGTWSWTMQCIDSEHTREWKLPWEGKKDLGWEDRERPFHGKGALGLDFSYEAGVGRAPPGWLGDLVLLEEVVLKRQICFEWYDWGVKQIEGQATFSTVFFSLNPSQGWSFFNIEKNVPLVTALSLNSPTLNLEKHLTFPAQFTNNEIIILALQPQDSFYLIPGFENSSHILICFELFSIAWS